MTFGLKNAPPTFQRFIDKTFKDLQRKIMYTVIDDIVLFAYTLEEHGEKMNLIMERLRKSNLQLNCDKCEFLKKKSFLFGTYIKPRWSTPVRPDPRKLEAVDKFPRPNNVKNVRQFSGLSEYYRRFIKTFSKISKLC